MDATSREIRRLHTTLLLSLGVAVVTLLAIFVVAPYISHQQAIRKAELACVSSDPYFAAIPCEKLHRLRGGR